MSLFLHETPTGYRINGLPCGHSIEVPRNLSAADFDVAIEDHGKACDNNIKTGATNKMNAVTLTGADDRTDISAMIDLSAEFPFVEWGILVSAKQEGSSRFPSRNWMERFCHRAAVPGVAISMHVCGSWVRAMLRGHLDWNALPEVRIVADRVQVNTHAEEHVSNVAFLDWIGERSAKQFIIQLDAVNDHILDAAFARKSNVAGLFDGSHGAGILPAEWPTPRHKDVYYGYAGGLGPDNVVDQIAKISKAASWHKPGFWIDMEGRVRTHEEFDIAKARRVLDLCAPLVATL